MLQRKLNFHGLLLRHMPSTLLRNKILFAFVARIFCFILLLLPISAAATATQQQNIQDRQKQDRQVQARHIFQACERHPHCIVNKLEILAGREQKTAVIAILRSILAEYRDTSEYCHTFAHHIGEFVYAYTKNLPESLFIVDPTFCGGAAYHGIVQHFLTDQAMIGKFSPDSVDIKNLCPFDRKNPVSIDRWECLHGVGHGLASIYLYDSNKAVRRCAEFESTWEQVTCSKGLFMEIFSRASKKLPSDIKEDDPFFPCNSIDQQFSAPCYHYLVSYRLGLTNNIDKTAAECQKINAASIEYCFRGLGRAVATISSNTDLLKSVCQNRVIPKPFQLACHLGAAMVLSDNRNSSEALKFCGLISEEHRNACFTEVGKWIKLVYPTEAQQQKECTKAADSESVQQCRNASLENIKIL